MKKIYFSFLVLSVASTSFAQSTAWMVADSFKSVAMPGSGPGNPAWNVPSQPLMHSGTSYVAASTPGGGGTNNLTDYAYFYHNSLNVPGTATITGVEVMFSRFGCNGGDHSEDTISLAYNGAAIGNYVADVMSGSDVTDTFGSSTSLWGTALTPAMVNAYSFGIFYHTRTVGTCTVALQDCRIKVHYTTTTGVNEIAGISKAILYPNPATSIITFSPSVKGSGYSITDYLGRVVLYGGNTGAKTEINIAGLAPGLYFIRSNDEVAKFVKQ